MTDSDSNQLSLNDREGITTSGSRSPENGSLYLNNGQMNEMYVVDELPTNQNESPQVQRTDGLNVDLLMSNISKLVSETVKKELDKVNTNCVQSTFRPSQNRCDNTNMNGAYGDTFMYSPVNRDRLNGNMYHNSPSQQGESCPMYLSNSRNYSGSHYDQRSSFDRFKEDLSVKVKPFIPRENNWFTYKMHFEAIAAQAGWSERTKCTRLMNSLTGNLLGVVAGLPQPIMYDHLVSRLDAIHGVSNARDHAFLKLTNIQKQVDESIPMFAERVRQLVEQAHPNFIAMDKDEQGLRYFLQGLPPKHDLRMQMRMQNFQTLHEAAAYGARLEQVMLDERKFQQQNMYSTRKLNVDQPYQHSGESELIKRLESLCDTMIKQTQGNSGKQNQVFKANKFVPKQERKSSSSSTGKIKNGACFNCGEVGHWKNECPGLKKGRVTKSSSGNNSLN